ncbi:MAG: hypothetical protein JSW58_10020 [Candidatus Latescibacterota bacterium]|nr:MAG: hypothetical protein JSW58_10020 [Candidatus Latescibacterota bacterium]
MKYSTTNKTSERVLPITLILLTALVVSELISSVTWRMAHDTPLLHYTAYLVDRHDYVPYQDVFAINMPGTILFHLCIGKLFGYGDLAFRLTDIVYLLFLLALTWKLMVCFGRRVAWGAVLLFGGIYLGSGPAMSLQRDYLGILPIAAAVLLSNSVLGERVNTYVRAVVVGALFGLSASIKPHLAIGLPVVVVFMATAIPNGSSRNAALIRSVLKYGVVSIGGFLLVIALPIVWLSRNGGLLEFWAMSTRYLPLYLKLIGEHEVMSGFKRWAQIYDSYRQFGGHAVLLASGVLGTYMALFETKLSSRQSRLVVLLAVLTLLYSTYPVLAGQFFNYHWMPFTYFASLLAALLLRPFPTESQAGLRRGFAVLMFLFLIITTVRPASPFVRQLSGGEPAPPGHGRVDEIAGFLGTHLMPDDRVQPLDWTSGAVHALLLSHARVATPFVYDFHFYHHVSDPYIQNLRRKFITLLEREKPRFLVLMSDKDRPIGEDTTTEFPELERFVDANYHVVLEGDGYAVLEISSH